MKKNNNYYTDIYSYFFFKKKNNKRMMKKIYSFLRVDSTFMTTSHNRMFDVNKVLKKYINKYFSKKIEICDFAISSGQSTYELYKTLNKHKIKNVYGFDKKIYIKIFKIQKLILVYGLKNDLLMVEFNKYCLRYRYFFLFKKVEKILFNLLYFFNIKYKSLKLLIPSLNGIKKFKFFEQDIFNVDKKYFNFFDVVRVSNLLNYAYFSEEKLKKAVLNIKKISKENSIILINRTPNGKFHNNGSFFIKKKGKFILLEDVNEGSEIKELMLI